MLNSDLRTGKLPLKTLFKVILVLIAIILLVVYFILPIELPYSFDVPGKVLAAEEWLIIKSSNGQLLTLLRDNRTGISKSYSIAEFERGDNVKFVINTRITMESLISKSDTIGSILSNELELRLVSLKGQLNVAHSLLNQSLTGEKESLIKEAEDNLALAVGKTELDKKIFLRQQKLFEKGFISEEEFDISKNTLELDEISVEATKARLQTVLTGEKKEQIDLIKSQIDALEKESRSLEKKSASYHLISPLNGFIKWIPAGDTLVVISDTSDFVITLPIPLLKKNYVRPDLDVQVFQPISNEQFAATLKRLNNSIEYLFSKPFILASATVVGPKGNLMPGLMVQCTVKCGNISISEHIKRIFSSEIF
ncbi:MAG: hypothetical protein A2315_10515 [Ignavibacteria bacterium RIFOXYB2_FULL_35_12]|nr:MAG: hypothetical protein A2058_09460 [Ignavibacteria bacterium GWA2_36_19]OGU50284.1 MAG: hypothetical protein A2006_05720 [Ignavibacteria bacterium GWC2_35_8]OGU58003.1 MAG: hypothetical protein A2X60_02850 [Ignavibacteria bacterium GWF2_35_20]OGU78038.1 MAG: hypothetical protein A2254_09495 [Ignavibacteria bacterium RIFOXYA2_FULL_35_9]OGU90532.1 MAG: hypothetical protein A2492_06325 [Ignavibacteria bacterium RIFOXYC12_FULL_35_11]OGU91953.1 MAG: hypothetical protein A3K31_17690 [Ignavibac